MYIYRFYAAARTYFKLFADKTELTFLSNRVLKQHDQWNNRSIDIIVLCCILFEVTNTAFVLIEHPRPRTLWVARRNGDEFVLY